MKKVIGILLCAFMLFGVVACSDDSKTKETKEDTSTNSESILKSDSIKRNKETINKLGKVQSERLKALYEKYNVTIEPITPLSKGWTKQIQISTDNKNIRDDDDAVEGYMVHSIKEVRVDKDTSHDYGLTYDAYVRKDDKCTLTFHVNLIYPETQTFNMDNWEFFKETVIAFYGEDYNYDLSSLKEFVDTFIASPETNYYDTRKMGPFSETIGRGEWAKGVKFVEFKVYLVNE